MMRLIIIFSFLLLIKSKAQFEDTEFSHECYFKDLQVRPPQTLHLEYTCKRDGKSRRAECLDQQNYDQSEVEVIKYLCENGLNLLNLYPDVFNQFANVHMLDTSYLGINCTNCVRSGSTLISENKISRWKSTNNRHTQIPIPTLDCMPKLNEIDFSHNHISVLNFKNVKKATQIAMVNCSYNSIANIDSGTFSMLLNLETLDLSHNRIARIDEDAFSDNRNLKVLCLGDNPLAMYTSELIAPLRSLEILDLSNTQIGQGNDGSFKNNPNLKELDLRGVPLKKFSFRTLSSKTNEVEVHFPANSIEELDISCVNLSCHFKQFHEDDFFKNLRIFNVSGNNFNGENISKLLGKIEANQLKILDLSHNAIGTLNEEMLRNFQYLQHLNLSHSQISEIENGAFKKQFNLESLDLSHNNLETIDPIIFSFRSKLKCLNLRHNQLTQIDKVARHNLQVLKSLTISENPFDPVYLESYLEEWKPYGVEIDATTQIATTKAETTTFASAATSSHIDSSSILSTITQSNQLQDIRSDPPAQDENMFTSSTNLKYVIIGVVVLIVVIIIVVAIILYTCRRRSIRPASIPLSNVSTYARTNVTTLSEESPYEEIREPLPSAYAVSNIHQSPHYENASTHTATIDRYQNYKASLNSNEYATVYHHYATISKPRSKLYQ